MNFWDLLAVIAVAGFVVLLATNVMVHRQNMAKIKAGLLDERKAKINAG